MNEVKAPAWKFFRSEMATIVWDKDNNCELAIFENGVFQTEDKRTAEILRAKGYIEIPLDADAPPETIKVMPAPIRSGSIPLMPAAAAALNREGAESMASQIQNKMDAAVDVPQATGQTVKQGAPATPSRVKS